MDYRGDAVRVASNLVLNERFVETFFEALRHCVCPSVDAFICDCLQSGDSCRCRYGLGVVSATLRDSAHVVPLRIFAESHEFHDIGPAANG